ncbi:hypothetical protein ACSBOB_21170 [Mesorhizobium sp. ASY16-5R]|uniref:hypothetical protein n=1 Tax=Mesorhizobium sp. ASY16-5R TaxID=3445772 RepID=UPI003F9F7269
MIKTALVAMTVIGCDCDAKLCEYIAETPAQWTTVAECEAAMQSQIVGRNGFDYPLISGICRTVPDPVGNAIAVSASREAGWHAVFDTTAPRAEGFYGNVVAGSQMVFRRSADGYALVRSGFGQAADGTIGLFRRSASYLLPAGWVAQAAK